jgi:hypothetical protein
MNPFQIILALVFAAACVYTVLGYPARYGALTGRSRLFRTVGLFLFDLLLGLVLLGTFIDFAYNTTRVIGNFRALSYALACLFLALALMCIAILDWLESLVAYRREQRNLLQQMAREEWERAQQGKDEAGRKSDGSGGAA